MPSTKHRRRDLAIILLITGLPFFILYLSTRPGRHRLPASGLIMSATAPLQFAIANVFGGLADLLHDYVVLTDVKRENRELVREVSRLTEENRRLSALAVENRRLRDMLGFRDRHELDNGLLAARVIGRSITPYFRVVRIRLGAGKDQVKAGMPVITRDGVVGTIDRVASDYSDVMLLVDARSSIDVVSRENRVRGIVKGQGEIDRYSARMEYTLRTDELKLGEVVVTSGMGMRFPPNLVVGTVESIEKKQYGLYQKVTLMPSVDFSRLEEVFVIVSPPEPRRRATGSSP